MECSKRNSKIVGFAAMSLVVITMFATITIIASIPQAKAQSTKLPISVVGNPHDFSVGPPIPSCKADFNQGPPNDPLRGCKDTP
jgi:hypothetical protein